MHALSLFLSFSAQIAMGLMAEEEEHQPVPPDTNQAPTEDSLTTRQLMEEWERQREEGERDRNNSQRGNVEGRGRGRKERLFLTCCFIVRS